MKRVIDVDTLYQCETCYYHNDGKCSPSIWCENGEKYRPNFYKLQIIEIDENISNEPLTYDELFELAKSGEYGAHIWVKDLIRPYDIVACITDIFFEEVIAVWAVEQWYRGIEYGETWVAYRNKPEREK